MLLYKNKKITAETYRYLRVSAGLSDKSDEAIAIGLANTLFSVLVEVDEKPVGMGRVIGDGGCFCQVTDICVLPSQQWRGIGKAIMQAIKTYIDEQLPAGCYISLLADGKANLLYEQFGFKDTLPLSRGMCLKK